MIEILKMIDSRIEKLGKKLDLMPANFQDPISEVIGEDMIILNHVKSFFNGSMLPEQKALALRRNGLFDRAARINPFGYIDPEHHHEELIEINTIRQQMNRAFIGNQRQ